MKDAFALTAVGKPADKVYRIGDKLYVVTLKERQIASPEKFKEKREELRTSALARKRNDIMRSVVKTIREQASVQINERLLSYDAAANAEG